MHTHTDSQDTILGDRIARELGRSATLADVVDAGIDVRGIDYDELVLAGVDIRGVPTQDLLDAGIWFGREYAGIDVAGLYVYRLHRAVADAVGDHAEHLDMGTWHTSCGTAHCRAGWAVTLAGEQGEALEESVGTERAATTIYRISDPSRIDLPLFFVSRRSAHRDIQHRAAAEDTWDLPLPSTAPRVAVPTTP